MTRPAGKRERTSIPASERERIRLAIEGLGAEGDGIASAGGVRRHVSGALPGETVLASGQGRLLHASAILEASPSRVTPLCPLAARCGGCTLQHWDRAASLAWKEERVRGALEAAGFDRPAMRPAVQVETLTRRRVILAFSRRADGAPVIGLHRRLSREIVDMTECHVLHPSLFSLLAPFRSLLRSAALLSKDETGVLAANLLDDGPDLLLRTRREPGARDRVALAAFAATTGASRISWQADPEMAPEPVAVLRRPRVTFGGQTVEPAPGAFLQAVATAEAAISADAVEALPSRLRPGTVIAELYAGSGTLSFPLASRGRVRAYEGDALAFETLRRASGGTRVDPVRRDLARAPVTASEMRDVSVVVLDPPHGGAGRQVDEIAAARPTTVVSVSCNPASLGRDAATLRRAGYALEGARAIDQFLFSARVESVSVFRLG